MKPTVDSQTIQEVQQVELARLQHRVQVALARRPGDLLLTGGRVVNVFTDSVEEVDVVIADGWIAAVGPPGLWQANQRIDLAGRFVLPGLIDAHMHLESTLLLPGELARLVVPHGTAAIVADPHEIANVMGAAGIELLIAASQSLPLDFFFTAPSCVPATASEEAGAQLDAAAVDRLLQEERVVALGEVMDFPAVLAGGEETLRKIQAARRRGAAVDGHAPSLSGRELVAYVAADIRADHESTEAEEAAAKAALGMLVQVREGSSERNLEALLPPLVAGRLGQWCLASDDLLPVDVLERGHLESLLRRIVAAGVDPAVAVRHATLVPAVHYRLGDRGAVAPGYRANLAVVDDLRSFRASLVIHQGRTVARDGQYLMDTTVADLPLENSVHLGALTENDLTFRPPGGSCAAIELVPDQIITRMQAVVPQTSDGLWRFAADQDVSVIASIERHRSSGHIGLGLVSGFGFRRHGALGSSVAHDSHNLIVAGTSPRDMLACVRYLQEAGGGFVVVADGQVQAALPLPVAGLMSRDTGQSVSRQLEEVRAAAAALGCQLASPLAALSFLALPVIPELRITTRGMLHVPTQQLVS